MTILGNIFLGIASLIFLLLFSEIYLKTHARGGDAVMGFAWGVIILHLVFLACMAVVALSIGLNGGFEWISPSALTRNSLVIFGLLAMVFSSGLTALFKNEPGTTAAFLRIFSGIAPALIPLVLVVCSAILLNSGFRASTPLAVYKIPLSVVFWLSVVILSAAILSGLVASFERQQSAIQEELAFQDKNHQRMLEDIDSCDVEKNMLFILVHSDRNQDADVREKAVAKIKTHSKWQQELIGFLESDWAPQAFNYLASNDVEDKSLFLEPINQGILIQARLTRKDIRNCTYFYPDMKEWDVKRVLWTVERYEGMGVDFLPAVKELRAAFDEPAEVEKTALNATAILDRWIKSRQ